MIVVNPTEKFALSIQIADGNTTRFVEAKIFDKEGELVLTIQLSHLENGFYRRETSIDVRGNYQAQIFTYDDTARLNTLGRNLVTINVRLDDTLGPGAVLRNHNVCDANGNPVEAARVHVTSDVMGKNQVAGVRLTDINGDVTFFLDAGTWYFFVFKEGLEFDNPDIEVFDDT